MDASNWKSMAFKLSDKKYCDSYVDSAIAILDDDSLIQVFKYLSIADRVRAERVCKRWQLLSEKSWYELKELDVLGKELYIPFKQIFGLKPTRITSHRYPEISEDVAHKLLKRCGKYLKKIWLKNDRYCHLSTIALYCPQIQTITCNEATISGIEKLVENCNNIFHLNIEGFLCMKFKDELIKYFFEKENVRISDVKRFEENNSLKLTLDEMITFNVQSIDIDILKNFRHHSLKITNTRSYFDFKNGNEIIFTILQCSNYNLTNLHLESTGSDINNIDDKLLKVFENHRKIKALSLENFEFLTGKCLLNLNKHNIEEIRIYGVGEIHSDYFFNSLPNFKNLNKLYLQQLWPYNGDLDPIVECIRLCSSIKDLYIDLDLRLAEYIKAVSTLKNLETLKVSFFHRKLDYESFFKCISCNLLKLRHLEIYKIRGTLNRAFELLWDSPNLEEVVMMNVNDVTGYGLDKLINLKKLNCCNCPNFESDNLIKLLKCAPNLEYLRCPMKNSVIDVAIDVTKNRTNNVLLTIYCCGMSTDSIMSIDNIPTLLSLK